MSSLRLYLYWLPCFKVNLGQVLSWTTPDSPRLKRNLGMSSNILIFNDMYFATTETHSKHYFSAHKNGLQQFEKSLLNNQERNNCRRTARWCQIWYLSKKHFAVISIFLVTPSKLAYKPSVLFRLSETKVVNVSAVNVEINLWID